MYYYKNHFCHKILILFFEKNIIHNSFKKHPQRKDIVKANFQLSFFRTIFDYFC